MASGRKELAGGERDKTIASRESKKEEKKKLLSKVSSSPLDFQEDASDQPDEDLRSSSIEEDLDTALMQLLDELDMTPEEAKKRLAKMEDTKGDVQIPEEEDDESDGVDLGDMSENVPMWLKPR